MLTGAIVLARVIAGPIANLFQKRLAHDGVHPVIIIVATHALLSAAALPLLILVEAHPLPFAFWATMALCAVLAVAGNVLLVYALRSTDLSILGPINAYKAVVSMLLGLFLLGEVPTAAGLAGVLLILGGSYFVVERVPERPRGSAYVRFFRMRGVQLRIAALLFSATEAVFLKRALMHASPGVTFLTWCLLGLPVGALALLFLFRGEASPALLRLRGDAGGYLRLALATGLMQVATLYTFDALQVGYSLALFQLSTLLTVFLGYRFFAERDIGRRLLGAGVMGLGALLIALLGG